MSKRLRIFAAIHFPPLDELMHANIIISIIYTCAKILVHLLYIYFKLRGNKIHVSSFTYKYNYSTIIWLGARKGWVQKTVHSTIRLMVFFLKKTHDAELKINQQ